MKSLSRSKTHFDYIVYYDHDGNGDPDTYEHILYTTSIEKAIRHVKSCAKCLRQNNADAKGIYRVYLWDKSNEIWNY